jgi:putative endonuclease
MSKKGWVYIMCSMNNTTLYVGVTSTLGTRIAKHKENYYAGSFSAKYNCKKLVFYREFENIVEAIAEEKRIKGGNRRQKENLINSMNPEWKYLYDQEKLL